MTDARQVRCPTCRKTGDWFGGRFGPFCSKRCRLIDLGKWFGEEHSISEPLKPAQLACLGEPPAGAQPQAPEDLG
jgi:endogenous inhibitor of DNA gyrase (YacG/DUF329 family)